MGFYGNVSAAQNTTFTFDRIYPNFALMSENCGVDGVYPGRYVLVEYDSALTIGSRGFMRVFRDGGSYYIDKQHSQMVLYGSSNTVNTITPGRLAYYTENDDWDGLTGEPGLVTFLICCNTTSDTVGQTPAAFREIVTSDNRPYTINFNVDKNYLQYKKGAREKDIGRGFDSTVWQKLYINGVEQYVQIAELNSVVPTFDIGMDAPTGFPTIPHWDTNSTTVYYKVHWQPQWGMRFKSANVQSGPKFLDSGEPVETADAIWGPATTGYSTDVKVYPSDETTTWVRKEYNKTTELYTYYYYAKKDVEDPETHETTSTWDWYTASELNADSTLTQDIPAAIYYNAAGFDSEYSHYSSDEPMIGESNGWDGEDRVLMAPTGVSGHVYQHHDGTIHQDVAEDIQELSMMLPSVGNTIAKVWDIVYGDRSQNGYEINPATGKYILPAGQTKFKRNQDIQWNSTRGLRAVTLDPESLGYKYDSNQINTLAGTINSAHDLMGMILVESDAPMNGEEVIRNASFDNIYYFTHEQKFCRKHATYRYSGQDLVNDYSWKLISLTADTWKANTYYVEDNAGSLQVTSDVGTVILSADRADSFDSNKRYFGKYIKEFTYTAVTEPMTDYVPNHYYYRDPFGNYTLATEDTFFVDKNYYELTVSPSLTFNASYEPSKYFYLSSSGDYVIDDNVDIDGSRNYRDFTPTLFNKYIYRPVGEDNIAYYYDSMGTKVPDSGLEPTLDREYWVRTLQKQENSDLYEEIYTSIGIYTGDPSVDNLVAYTPGMYYAQEVETPEVEEGQSPGPSRIIKYKIYNGETFTGNTSKTYYTITDNGAKFLYIPNVYHMKEGNIYYKAYSSLLIDDTDYRYLSDVTKADKFYTANTYYVLDDDEYVLASDVLVDGTKTYYIRDTYYVFNDELNRYSQGAIWNDAISLIPSTIILGTRTETYEMKEMPEFARGMNTLHGAILRMAQLMELDDAQTRDTSTVQGCINQMNDILNKFGAFNSTEFTIVDNYGRLTSAPWTTSQSFVATNNGTSSGSSDSYNANENRWLYLNIDDNAATPKITLEHRFTAVTDTTTTSNKNSSTGSGLNKGVGGTLKLYTPIVDNMGHVVGKNVETVTLPYDFKTFSFANSSSDSVYDTSSLSANDIVADAVSDTFTINGGNKWIHLSTLPDSNTLTIAHETHTITTTAKTATDLNAGTDVSTKDQLTLQELAFDAAGHVTAHQNHTFTLPYGFKTISIKNSNASTGNLGNAATVIADGTQDTLNIEANEWITVTPTDTNGNDKIVINHAYPKQDTDSTSTTDKNGNGDTIPLETVTLDTMGHVTKKNVNTVTLPYAFKTITPGVVASNGWIADQSVSNTAAITAPSTQASISILGNNWIKLSGSKSNNSNTYSDVLTIAHGSPDSTAGNLTGVTSQTANITNAYFGGTITIPTFKYDKAGHVASTSSYTVNIPGLSQTDTAADDGTLTADVLTSFVLTSSTASNPTAQLQAKKRTVGSLPLTGYDVPSLGAVQALAATDSINGAFSKLQNSINVLNANNTTAGSIAKAIKDAIDGLDVSSTTTDIDTTTHMFVTSITETDGKISVKTRSIDASDLPDTYISATTKPTGIVASSSGGTTTDYSNKTYIEIIKDLASRLAALEDPGS